MSKRVAEGNGSRPLKGGERPEAMDIDDKEMGDFEDEFEDEFESEDEIFEAGVDGRPDAEREAEEKAGKHHHFLTKLTLIIIITCFARPAGELRLRG